MKKKLIYILIGTSAVLLIANLIINWTTKEDPVPKNLEVNTVLIDSLFKRSVSKFNLDSTWIKFVPINSRQYDSLNHVYKIQLPGDLRPAIVLLRLKEDFKDIPVKLISDEKIVNGYTTLNILSNDHLKLQATFTVEDEFVRSHTKLAFILNEFENVDEQAKISLFYSVLPFSLLLEPSVQSDSLLKDIAHYKKTYSLLIDDGIQTPNYALETGFSKTHLSESIRYISWNYPLAELYIINEKSELFNSTAFNFIKDEFQSRNITLNTSAYFITLPSNLNEAKSLLNFYLESSVGNLGKIIIVPAKIFLQLEKILLEAKQRGTKFYSPKELMKVNEKMNTVN